MFTATAVMALMTEFIGMIRERMSLANKRADLATSDDDKRKAIDEGLVVSDAAHKLVEKLGGMLDGVKADVQARLTPKTDVPTPGLK